MKRARDAALRKRTTGATSTTTAATPSSQPQTQPTPSAPAAPDDDPSTRLYRKLRAQEEAQRIRVKATSFDLNDARDKLDKLMAPKKVNGTGDIKVSVKPARTRTGAASVLKKVAMDHFVSGKKAEVGRPAPPAATGENHDPSLDS
jgi:hypothetical protein